MPTKGTLPCGKCLWSNVYVDVNLVSMPQGNKEIEYKIPFLLLAYISGETLMLKEHIILYFEP